MERNERKKYVYQRAMVLVMKEKSMSIKDMVIEIEDLKAKVKDLKEQLHLKELEVSSLWSQKTIEQYEREELGK